MLGRSGAPSAWDPSPRGTRTAAPSHSPASENLLEALEPECKLGEGGHCKPAFVSHGLFWHPPRPVCFPPVCFPPELAKIASGERSSALNGLGDSAHSFSTSDRRGTRGSLHPASQAPPGSPRRGRLLPGGRESGGRESGPAGGGGPAGSLSSAAGGVRGVSDMTENRGHLWKVPAKLQSFNPSGGSAPSRARPGHAPDTPLEACTQGRLYGKPRPKHAPPTPQLSRPAPSECRSA